MITKLRPLYFLSLVSIALATACTPDAKNGPAKVTSDPPFPEDETTSEPTNQEPSDTQIDPNMPLNPLPSEEPTGTPPPPPKINCPQTGFSTEHQLTVRALSPDQSSSGKPSLEVDFLTPAERSLQVVSVYVNKPEDQIPTFTNNFKFSGTSYWMVAVDNPFEEYFSLPSQYAVLPALAVDVSQRYGGKLGGVDLSSIKEPTCLKFTVVTFEPEMDIAFRQSEVRYPYFP